ncbi:hypothetical protein [Streptomyces sp. NPDC054854]
MSLLRGRLAAHMAETTTKDRPVANRPVQCPGSTSCATCPTRQTVGSCGEHDRSRPLPETFRRNLRPFAVRFGFRLFGTEPFPHVPAPFARLNPSGITIYFAECVPERARGVEDDGWGAYRPALFVVGQWSGRPGTDTITLNSDYLGDRRSRGTTAHRRRVATHELGHAPGFCHKPMTVSSIMWTDNAEAARFGIDQITPTDRTHYHQLWG